MRKEVIKGIVAFTFSTVASSYILVRSCTFKTNNIAVSILALASLLLIALHISTTMIFKPNQMWFISKAIIIPEIISLCLLSIWKPVIGFIEIALVILSTAFSLRSSKGKTKAKNLIIRIKRLLRGINASITLCSLILIPSIIIMTPYLRNSGKALITIPTHEISHTNDYHIPDKWSLITITQKTEFIEEFSEILASELNMDTVPSVKICYMPLVLYGSYSNEEDIILLNAGIVQDSDVEQIASTLSHEFFHRYQYTLVEDYSNGTLSDDNLSDDVIERINSYAIEMSDYHPGGTSEESYEKYYTQACEVDARAYSEITVSKYFNT